MSLHQTVDSTKKGVIFGAIGIGIIIFIYILLKFTVVAFQSLFPPVIPPPNVVYGKLPAIQFPQNGSTGNFTYTLNTVSGSLPVFADRINVYQINQPQPNIVNLDTAKNDATSLGFTDNSGNVLPETYLGNATYEWDENTGLNSSLKINIINFRLSMTSNFATSLTVLQAQNLSDQTSALTTVTQNFLTPINLLYSDIDLSKTQSPNPNDDFNTAPQLFTITPDGQMTPTTSLASAQIIRVDLYQKDVNYWINALLPGDKALESIQETLPIVYPNPPYSTMTFWVASGDNNPEIVQASYYHQNINFPQDPTQIGVYPIKTAQLAYNDLKSGNAYIAPYSGSDTNIIIDKIYLAYFMGNIQQQYLMPVIVFEGNNGFFAYVSAVSNQQIQ